MVTITAECDRFLYNMMRIIAGTLVEVALLRAGVRVGSVRVGVGVGVKVRVRVKVKVWVRVRVRVGVEVKVGVRVS